jgi:uracil-DNA glycosylase
VCNNSSFLSDQAVIISNQFSIRLGNYSLPLVLKTNKELLQAQITDSKGNPFLSSMRLKLVFI